VIVAERGRGSRRAAVVVGAALALLLAGCSAFMPAFDGDFPSSSPIARYSTGTATIAIKDGETIKLDEVAAGAGVDSMFGSNIRWTGPSGWNLRLTGAGGDKEFGMGPPFLQFDRIVDGKHWQSQYDGSRCIVDVEVADAKALRGTATCKGVEWYDALDLGFPVPQGEAKPVNEPKFDAEVTFEAVP
jgi:hypothetical protein